MKKQLLRNLFSNYLTSFTGMVLGFAVIPFLIHKLGKDAFGLIVLAESAIVLFELVTVSVKMSLARYATFHLTRGEQREFESLLSIGHRVFCWGAILVLAVGSTVAWSFQHLFSVPSIYVQQSRILFILITVAFAVTVPNMTAWSMLYSKHRYDLINLASSMGLIVRAIGVFALYSLLPEKYSGLVLYGVAYLGMNCIQSLMVHIQARRIFPDLRLSRARFDRLRVRELAAFSAYFSIGQVSTYLYQNTANVIINLLWGPAANAIYSVSVKFPNLMLRLFQEATWSVTSTVNAMVAESDHDGIRRLYFSYTKALTIVTAPICLGLIVLSGPLIRVWVGGDFALAGKLLPVFAAPLLAQLPMAISACLLNAYAEVKVPSVVSLSMAVANVVLSIVLGYEFSLGLLGIAIASSFCIGAYTLVFLPYYTCRISGISYGEYMLSAYLPPLLWAGIIMGSCFQGLRMLTVSSHWGMAALMASGIGVGYISGIRLFLLEPREKEYLSEMLGKVWLNLIGVKAGNGMSVSCLGNLNQLEAE